MAKQVGGKSDQVIRSEKTSMLFSIIAEATECDFKSMLERKKPRSWLKSVSAFANGIGGSLFFGVNNDRSIAGLSDAQSDADFISETVVGKMSPIPDFILTPRTENGQNILVLTVKPGQNTPYFYVADGARQAYVRIGNESIPAPDYMLNELILRGTNRTYDAIVTEHRRDDYSFTLLEATYRQRTGIRFDDGDYRSFGLVDKEGHLTRAGMLLADQPAVYTSRLFCTRWNGLEKGSIFDDALDDKEYSGNLMYLLDSGCDFVKNNSKVRFAKAATERIDKPDYAERAVTEALVNALIHRDYLMIGSEIHIDIYDDRVEISSPGGMYGGGLVQNKNIENIRSERRNPVIADLFHRMKYMERRGSGLKKIVMETKKLPGFKDKFMPDFFSSDSSFTVIMKNINYLSHTNLVSSQDSDQVGNQDTDQDAAVNLEKMILDFCSSPRRKKEICQHFGYVNLTHFTRKHLTPLLESGRLKLTLPDRPTSKNQKYVQA